MGQISACSVMKKPFGASGLAVAAFTACTLLLRLQAGARGEGSSGGLQPPADVLLLYSGCQQAANWFNASSTDALLAARLASEDIAACGDSLLVSVHLVEESCVGNYSLALNHSLVAVLSAECNGVTCQSPSLSHGLPVISYSPACLGGNNITGALPFCMLPSLDHLPVGIATLFSQYDWQRAAVVSELGSHLVASPEDIYLELTSGGVGDIRQSLVSSNDTLPSDILHRDYRIVVLNLTPHLARRILCEGMYRKLHRHVWIIPGWYPHSWWMGGDPATLTSQSHCLDEELGRFLGRGNVLSVLQRPPQPLHTDRSTSAGFVRWCGSHGIVDCAYAGLAYDAVWTIAHALANNLLLPSDLRTAVAESDFVGVSGHVRFASHYRVWGGHTVGQMRYGERLERVPVATISEDVREGKEGEGKEGEGKEGEGKEGEGKEGEGKEGEEKEGEEKEGEGKAEEGKEGERKMLLFSYTHNESETSVWPNGVPLDGSPQEELKHPLLLLVILCYAISGTVILCGVVCIMFNICFRKKKLIKLTSPTLNYMIAVGIIINNLATPMFMYPAALEGALEIFCLVRPWLLPIGWSLSLCTISVKMWRVFIIYRTTMKLQTFKHKRLKWFLQDRHMVILVLCLLVVDVIVLIIGTSIPNTRFTLRRVVDDEFSSYRNTDDIEVVYHNLQCVSKKGLIWIGVLFGTKVLLQVSGMVLAFLTRKVEVRGLNESREVQLVMIITTPIVLAGLVLRMLFSEYLNVVGTVYALGTSISGGATLGIIFLPKMIQLYKNPSGDNVYLSRYHHRDLGCTNKLAMKGRTLNSSSSITSSFDPTASLKAFFRRTSKESEMSREEQTLDRNTTIRNVLFALPTIEEGTCSNDVTTTDCSGSAAEVNPFLPQEKGDPQHSKGCGSSRNIEDSICSTKFLLPTWTGDAVDRITEERDSDSDSMKSFKLAEEDSVLPSPTEPITFSQLTEEQRTARHSWCVSTSDSAADPSPLSTPATAVTTVSGHFQSMFDSSGVSYDSREGAASEAVTVSATSPSKPASLGKVSNGLTLEEEEEREGRTGQDFEREKNMVDSCSPHTNHCPTTETSTTEVGMDQAT